MILKDSKHYRKLSYNFYRFLIELDIKEINKKIKNPNKSINLLIFELFNILFMR